MITRYTKYFNALQMLMVRLVRVQNTKHMSAYRELTICQHEKCLNRDSGSQEYLLHYYL